MINLDVAATANYSEVDDIIVNTMTDAMKRYWQNPSSLYASDVKEEIDNCRANIAKFIGAKPEEIIFTSGASESNNLAIRGWCDKQLMSRILHTDISIISTLIEHKSIINLLKDNEQIAPLYVWVDEFGIVNYNNLEDLLQWDVNPQLVTIGFANNEIGVVQNIKIISDLVHKYSGILHVDATQAFGHIPINVEDLGIDMMSVSGHKISPVLRGIGFLYKRNGIDIQPLIYGTQEQGLRGGTENTFGIIGLSKAIEYCDVSYEKIEEIINKRYYFINQLETKFNCKLNGHNEYRLPNNINVTFPQNITGESLLYMLEMSNIYCSVGSACNSHTNVPSYVLKEIGLTDDEVMRSVRFTLPDDITYEEIDKVINEIDKAIKIITS